MTTLKEARVDHPGLELHTSGKNGSMAFRAAVKVCHRTGQLPPSFVKTMGSEDRRLARMTVGLGVVVNGEARFYPKKSFSKGVLEDTVGGQAVRISSELSGHLVAVLQDRSTPMQLFTRWYAFALTFPGCSIYGA